MTEKTVPEALRISAEMAETLGEHLSYGLQVVAFSKTISIAFYAHQGNAAEGIRATAKALGGRWMKNDPKKSDYEAAYYRLTNTTAIEGWTIELWTERTQICDRKQVGTRIEKVEAQPAVEAREVEVPIFEYECKPLNQRADTELDALTRELEAEVTA